MNEPRLDAVLQRLIHLEQANRRWKVLGLTTIAILGLVVLLGAAGRAPTQVDGSYPIYYNANQYRTVYVGQCGRLEQLAYIAGALDAFSVQAMHSLNIDAAAIVSRCLRGRYQSHLQLGQARAIIERYLEAHPEVWDLSMPTMIVRAFWEICPKDKD
jgi:hypothetical protein